jgi:phosphatidylinositol glycan class B
MLPIIKKYAGLLLIGAIYLLTAIHSNGFHHPDEHYQIVEFAGLKGGWNTGANLTWEYDAQIRPALQPMIALGAFRVLNLFGISNPFQLAMGLRILTAIFSIVCILFFIQSFRPSVKKEYQTVFVLLSFLLWFLPAVNVRFSSETWAGLTLLLSVALLNNISRHKAGRYYFLTGLLWGLSFEFRIQIGIALLGLFLWLLIIRKESWKNLLNLLSGSLVVVAVCTVLDSWFYGEGVFVPWNYFYTNMVEDVASRYGTSPWYYYVEQMFFRPTPLIGSFVVLSLITLLVFNYKHMVLWCIIPFIIIHSLIPHKELRFLFPIVNFLPLVLVLAFQEIRSRWKSYKSVLNTIGYPVGLVALVINAGGLLLLSFKPASDGRINMIEHIDQNYDQVTLYTIARSNPYVLNKGKGLTLRFYGKHDLAVRNLAEVLEPGSGLKLGDNDLVMLRAFYHERDYLEKEGFVIEKMSIPEWVARMDQFYKVYTGYPYVFVLYSKPHDTSTER